MDIFLDAFGNEIKNRDILVFENKHLFRCLLQGEEYLLECLNEKIPLLRLSKICVGNVLVSAKVTRDKE